MRKPLFIQFLYLCWYLEVILQTFSNDVIMATKHIGSRNQIKRHHDHSEKVQSCSIYCILLSGRIHPLYRFSHRNCKVQFRGSRINTMVSKNYPPTVISTGQTPEEEVCACNIFSSKTISDCTSTITNELLISYLPRTAQHRHSERVHVHRVLTNGKQRCRVSPTSLRS